MLKGWRGETEVHNLCYSIHEVYALQCNVMHSWVLLPLEWTREYSLHLKNVWFSELNKLILQKTWLFNKWVPQGISYWIHYPAKSLTFCSKYKLFLKIDENNLCCINDISAFLIYLESGYKTIITWLLYNKYHFIYKLYITCTINRICITFNKFP